MGILDKIKGNKNLSKMIVQDASEHNVTEFYHAGSITLNLLLSGKVDGGIPRGKMVMLAAPPAHSKTIIALISAANAQKKGCTVLWIDSEFAFSADSAKQFGVDTSPEKLILVQDNSIESVQSVVVNLFEEYNETSVFKVLLSKLSDILSSFIGFLCSLLPIIFSIFCKISL